jgi:hypothetical protein
MGRGKPPNALRAKGLEKEEEDELISKSMSCAKQQRKCLENMCEMKNGFALLFSAQACL